MPEIDANNLPDDVDSFYAMTVASQREKKTLDQERATHNQQLNEERSKHNAALEEFAAQQQTLKQHIVVLEQPLADRPFIKTLASASKGLRVISR